MLYRYVDSDDVVMVGGRGGELYKIVYGPRLIHLPGVWFQESSCPILTDVTIIHITSYHSLIITIINICIVRV